jgi:hypothetical protein
MKLTIVRQPKMNGIGKRKTWRLNYLATNSFTGFCLSVAISWQTQVLQLSLNVACVILTLNGKTRDYVATTVGCGFMLNANLLALRRWLTLIEAMCHGIAARVIVQITPRCSLTIALARLMCLKSCLKDPTYKKLKHLVQKKFRQYRHI